LRVGPNRGHHQTVAHPPGHQGHLTGKATSAAGGFDKDQPTPHRQRIAQPNTHRWSNHGVQRIEDWRLDLVSKLTKLTKLVGGIHTFLNLLPLPGVSHGAPK
jgi:hypothetical protein